MADSDPPLAGTRAWLWGKVRGERRRSEDLLKRAQWLQAEVENVRKAAERERAGAADKAVADFARRLLPALDSLDHALAGAEGETAAGLRLLRADLERALAAEGIAPLEAAGQPYDPLRHEAIGRTTRPCGPGESPGLRVAQELRRGYALKGRVLRPAMVHVVELTPPSETASEPQGA